MKRRDTVLQLLAQSDDGMTARQLVRETGIESTTLYSHLRRLRKAGRVYVDRWLNARTRVFAAVAVPEDCPRPGKP